MAKATVLHMVEDLGIGGLEKVIANIVMGLDEEKYEVEVWCLTRGGEVADELVSRGIKVKILKMDSYYNPLKILRLAWLVKKRNVDILHTHGYFAGTFGRLAAIFARTPVVLAHVHTTYYDFKKRNILIEKFLSFFTDKIVCISQAVERFVIEVEGVSSEKTCLIYNGVSTTAPSGFETDGGGDLKSTGFRSTDVVLISVASLTPHKGHRILMDAFNIARRRHNNLRLMIVGGGPLRQELEGYARKLQISSKVFFAGKKKNVFPLLRLANVFILASTEREGLGISLIEAMALGLPVIGTRVGGIPEVIEDNVNGLLASPGDSQELAHAIAKMVSDENLMITMGLNGRKIYERKFTAASMNKEIESLYDSSIKASTVK